MAECAASPSCIKLHTWRTRVKERGCAHWNSHLRTARSLCGCRKYLYGRCKAVQLSRWKMCELSAPGVLILKVRPDLRGTSFRCSCLGSLLNPDAATISDCVPVADQVLLMASIFLTYVAGVIPIQKSNFSSQKKISNDNVNPERSTSSVCQFSPTVSFLRTSICN